MAVLMLCALALVSWVAWNLMPRSVVNEAALMARQHSGRVAIPRTDSPSTLAPAGAQAPVASALHGRAATGAISHASTAAPSAPDAPKDAGVQPGEPAPTTKLAPDMLRLETEIHTPIRERSGNAAPARQSAKAKAGKASTGDSPPAR